MDRHVPDNQMNMADGVRQFAASTPNALALDDGARTLTFAALADRAARVANLLLASGVRSGDRVAVHAVCREHVFWETLEELKAVGASSVLVLPVEKMLA